MTAECAQGNRAKHQSLGRISALAGGALAETQRLVRPALLHSQHSKEMQYQPASGSYISGAGGFHFAEQGHPLGEELLRVVVDKGGRAKIAKMAKSKLALGEQA